MQPVSTRGLQPSLFEHNARRGGKTLAMLVQKASMIQVGYYFVGGTNVRVTVDGKITYIQRMENSNWRAGMKLIEFDTFEFTYECNDSNMPDLVEQLWPKQIEYARMYSRVTNRCTRCNRKLEHPRSRHYSIGPECEPKWPDIIIQVDDEIGFSWEELQEINSKRKNISDEPC